MHRADGIGATRTLLPKNVKRIKKLGEGGFGIVFKVSVGPDVRALKVFKKKTYNENFGLELDIIREIMILTELSHENIIKVTDALVNPKSKEIQLYYECLDTDLRKILRLNLANIVNPLEYRDYMDSNKVKGLIYQIVKGTKYLHENWVIHRDIKPENILMRDNGEIKLTDFGLARIFRDNLSSLGEFDQLVITRFYRPPEICLLMKDYLPAVDVWSIGCVFFELLKARRNLSQWIQRDYKKQVLLPMEDILFYVKGKESDRRTIDVDLLIRIFEVLGEPRWSKTNQGLYEIEGITIKDAKLGQQIIKRVDYHIKAGRIKSKREARQLLAERLGISVDSDEFRLLMAMLEYDPRKRILARKALEDPYFKVVDPLPYSIRPLSHFEMKTQRVEHAFGNRINKKRVQQ